METISVLISLYRPNETFLFKQLDSINNQDYAGNIEVLVRNDDPNDINREAQIKDHLANCNVQYYHSEQNLGYIKAFEQLVLRSTGNYIAFCDQDDIWRHDRISKALEKMQHGVVLSVCDRAIIDADDKVIIDSWRKKHPLSPECNWKTGDDFTIHAATRCYAIGMATIVRTDYAKSFCPFPIYTGHDKWVALCASASGPCAFIDEPLVYYRRHGSNVSGLLKGIHSKEDWYRERIEPSYEVAKLFAEKFPNCKEAQKILGFASARASHNAIKLVRYIGYDPTIVLFEIALAITPARLFSIIVNHVKY